MNNVQEPDDAQDKAFGAGSRRADAVSEHVCLWHRNMAARPARRPNAASRDAGHAPVNEINMYYAVYGDTSC